MKAPLVGLLVMVVLLTLLWWLRPTPQSPARLARDNLPWQVQTYPDGTSRVFKLHLGHATLADAIQRFGQYQEMAIFADSDAPPALEAYFGTVRFGPLEALIVAVLAVDPEQLAALIETSRRREGSPSGSWKYPITGATAEAQKTRLIKSITYVPKFAGLNPDYFRERFGQPPFWRSLGKQTVQWVYPTKGLLISLNDDGRDVLEFVAPRTLQLPPGLRSTVPPTIDD